MRENKKNSCLQEKLGSMKIKKDCNFFLKLYGINIMKDEVISKGPRQCR